jgi:hypothetical protein
VNLSYFNVIVESDAAGDFEQLVEHVHAQTTAAKERKAYVKGLAELAIANFLWPRLAAATRELYLADRKPVVGMLTNIRVPQQWAQGRMGELITDWRHAASTGPMTPLTVSACTFNGRLTCGISARTSGFDDKRVAAITSDFTARVESM